MTTATELSLTEALDLRDRRAQHYAAACALSERYDEARITVLEYQDGLADLGPTPKWPAGYRLGPCPSWCQVQHDDAKSLVSTEGTREHSSVVLYLDDHTSIAVVSLEQLDEGRFTSPEICAYISEAMDPNQALIIAGYLQLAAKECEQARYEHDRRELGLPC
jgi:hypothetical protein